MRIRGYVSTMNLLPGKFNVNRQRRYTGPRRDFGSADPPRPQCSTHPAGSASSAGSPSPKETQVTTKARSAKASSDRSTKQARPVAVLGGNRIPFARSDGKYAHASNQDMFTAALNGLISRFGLQGERLGMVVGGAVLKRVGEHGMIRESVLGS